LKWDENQLCGFHNNSSDLTHMKRGYLGRHRTLYHWQGNKPVAERLWGCVSAERQHLNTCCNCWYSKIFYYCVRNAICL